MSEDEECTLDDEPQEEGEETEIARVTMLEGRVRELEQAVVELDDTTQAFKLLAEKQAAEINAKELLLTRKSEYVDELLEQLKVLGGKLEARTAEVQTLESRALKLEAQATELREQVHKDEEDFAMVCAALDAREQMLAKKNSDLAVAAETEKQLRKELERHQGAIRRLEKNVEDLQPEKADACLSPRSFHENQLIRLRDDAIEAKTREVWLLTGQNDQLRVQLDELETALENLQSNVISKENDLVRRQRKIDRLETEIDALQVSRSQAEGREKAMEIATTQNAKLLQALEAQERSTEEMKARLEDCERECEQLRNTHREHIARSAESEVEVLHRTRQAEEKASIVSSLQEKLRRERKLLQEELSSSHLNYQMEIEKVQSELVMRRNKQYDLTLKLQDVEARLHEAVDRRESADEQLLAAQCRMQELERVLQDSLQCKKKLEEELESQKKRSGASVEKQNKILSEAKREIAALQKQLEGMKEALAKKLIQEKQHELRHLEEKQVFSAQEALAREQKERIHRLVRDVNRESQMRAGVELEKAAIKDQLETLRQQTENIIRECLEQKQQIQDKKQQLTEKFWQLTNEFHAVQSAKTKLVVRFADACTRAASASVATAAVRPVLNCLELRECWLVDDDLRPLLKMLDSDGMDALRRVDLRCNRLTSEGMSRLVTFLKRIMVGSASSNPWSTGSGIREVDLRQNCISLDGIRVVASGLESLIPARGSNQKELCPFNNVVVTDAGRIECFAPTTTAITTNPSCVNQQAAVSQTLVLAVDISANVDADWLVTESRRFHRRGSHVDKNGESILASPSNNRSHTGAAQLLDDALSCRDKNLQEIYGLDLVSAFMGHDIKPNVISSSKSSVTRRKNTSNENPVRFASPRTRASQLNSTTWTSQETEPSLRTKVESVSPRASSEHGNSADQLPVVTMHVHVDNSSPRMLTSLSLPRLSG